MPYRTSAIRGYERARGTRLSLTALGLALAGLGAGAGNAVADPAASQGVPADVNIVADTSGTATTQPDPGQIIVRLNGRFRSYGGFFDDADVDRTATSTTYTLSETPTVKGGKTGTITYTSSTSTTQNRQADYGLIEYLRLYPGFDGMTPGGLKYGTSIEIRQDSTIAPGGGTAGSVSGADAARGSLYVRREWGYLGTAELGTLRFGTIDSASSLYLTGVLENYNDGGWNGDVRYGLATQAQLRWPFADDGSYYATNKLVYMSPSFAGFDFGVSWEPSTAGANIDDGNCSVATTGNTLGTSPITVSSPISGDTGCDRLSSTSTAVESGRRRNTIDAVLRFRHAFDNGIGIAATGAYIDGSHVAYTGPEDTVSKGLTTNVVQYHGLSMADFGLAVTYAGLQIGGNYQFGRYNNALASGSSQSFTPDPVGAKRASAFAAGASYTVGPAIVGATWVVSDSQGAFAYAAGKTPSESVPIPGLGTRHEAGLNAGGTLKVAPGLGVIVSYLWDERKQPGYDFVNQDISAGTTDPTENNRIHAQILTVGTSISW